MYKSPVIEMQERESVNDFDRALATNDEWPSPKPLEDTTAHSLFASSELRAAVQERAKEETESL